MSARDDLRERVARAIHEAEWPEEWEDDREDVRSMAYRAADAAIREVVEAATLALRTHQSEARDACDEGVDAIRALAPERKTSEGGDDA